MKTFRKLAMLAVAIFAAISFTACGDDDEPVANASFDGTWKIIGGATTGQADFELIPDGFVKNPLSGTAVEKIYPSTLEFKADGTGVYTFSVTEYTSETEKDQTVVKAVLVKKTSAFTYKLADQSPAGPVKNDLKYITIDFAASPYFKSITQTASYRIEGNEMFFYHDFPRAADTLRKQ